MTTVPELERRLRRLEDRAEVAELVHAYCRHFDDNQPTRLSLLFTEDVELDYGPDRPIVHGRREARRRLARGLVDVFAATSHNVSNMQFSFPDDDHCTGVTYLYAWHRYVDGSPDGHLWARYHHRFVRTDQGWRIAHLQLRVLGTVDFHSKEVHVVRRGEQGPTRDR